MSNYRKILRTGLVMAGLVIAGSTVPAVAQTVDDRRTTDHDDRGFDDWGLLGLLGLAGLLGRKRERNVVETRRV